MKKLFILILVGVILLNSIGCGQIEEERNTSPDVEKTDLETLSDGNKTVISWKVINLCDRNVTDGGGV